MSESANPLSELYFAALEQPPEKRSAFLSGACYGKDQLRSQLEEMLSAHEEAKGFLSHPPQPLASVADAGNQSAVGCTSVLNQLRQDLPVADINLGDEAGDLAATIEASAAESAPTHRYQLHGEIARGGMGSIWKGRDVDLGRSLAVKVLLDSHRNNPEVVARFVEEAQIGGQLQHPGIAPVYELGQLPDQRPFFSMKLVKGETLAAILSRRKDVLQDRGKLLGHLEQVCQTVAYAHSRRVIHRDLKPANIMVGAFGEVQVMDWGLAKVLAGGGVADERRARNTKVGESLIQTIRNAEAQSSIGTKKSFGSVGSDTQLGSVMGTPAYMPPEQALGEVDRLNQSCDVFALGAILCEILTGEPPYVADDNEALLRQAKRADLADCYARLAVCGADEPLVELAKRCLHTEPIDRPTNAAELADALTKHQESVETRLRDAEVQRAAEASRAVEERKRRKLTVALAASVVVILSFAGGYWLWQENHAYQQKQAAKQIVKSSLEDAELQRRRAANTVSPQGRLAELEKALTIAHQAVDASKSDSVASEVGDEAIQLVSVLSNETEEARQVVKTTRRDTEFQRRLEAVRLTYANSAEFSTGQLLGEDSSLYLSKASSEYLDALSDADLKIHSDNLEELAGSIRQSTIRETWINAFDHWLSTLPEAGTQSKARQLRRIAQWDAALPYARERLQESKDSSLTWVALAPIFALADDGKHYQKFCREAARQIKSYSDKEWERNPFMADHLLKSCLLLPEAIDLQKLPIDRLLTLLETTQTDRFKGYFWAAAALYEYRRESFHQAREYIAQALEYRHDDFDGAMQAPIHAMVLHQLGQLEQAKIRLEESAKLITALQKRNRESRSMNQAMRAREGSDTLFAAVLQREAELLVAGNHTTPLSEIGFIDTNEDPLSSAPAVLRDCVVSLLDLADTNEWRKSIRRAILDDDLTAIQEQTADLQIELPSSEMVSWLATSLASMDKRSLAIKLLQDTQPRFPADFWINYLLAENLLEVERHEEALGFARAAYVTRPESASANCLLIETLFENGQYAQAELQTRRVLDTADLEPESLYALSWRLGQIADLKGALTARLTGASSSSPALLRLAATACRRAGEDGSASTLRYRRPLAGILLGLGEYNSAIETMEELTDVVTNLANYEKSLAATYFLSGQLEKAEELFRKGVETSNIKRPMLPFACFQLRGKPEDAQQLLSTLPAQRRFETSLGGWKVVRSWCNLRGQWSQAEKLYRQALTDSPANLDPILKFYLAESLVNKGQEQEAFELLSELIEDNAIVSPEIVIIHAALAGDKNTAVEQFEAQRSRGNTGNRNLLKNIAWLHASVPDTSGVIQAGTDAMNQAEEDMRRVVETTAHNSEAHHTLGVVFYRQQKWRESIEQLKTAVFLGKDDPYSWLFLAMAHRQLGEETEAESWFKKTDQWKSERPLNYEQRRFYDEAVELIYY
ncbi:MAG: protein kinase [Planctomycetota bacterium]